MSNRLKVFYQHLVEDKKHELHVWYNDYRGFVRKVGGIREELDNLPNYSLDDKFLRDLLYEDYNGVSSKGQSTLSGESFDKLIKDKDFIENLKNLIKDPNEKSYEEFKRYWKDKTETIDKLNHNLVIINRTAAACTLDVSTMVDENKFAIVFNWLVKEKLITISQNEKNITGWFSKNKLLVEKIREKLKEKKDEFYLNIFIWELYHYSMNPFDLKKQIVKYGAPGTGKTYQARRDSTLYFNLWKNKFGSTTSYSNESQTRLVQFHPSFTYEDFIEGLRPVLKDNKVELTLQNGSFKDFCKKAAQWEIDFYNLKYENKPNWEKATINDLKSQEEALKEKPHWKFILKIEDKDKLLTDVIPPFFFIIDEINRAELSRVFGELMYCLEYRGIDGKIKTQYSNLNNDNTGVLKIDGEFYFFIPTNLYLIGTMNTIDRSIESFDFALRRRFLWEEVKPDIDLLKHYLPKEWGELASNLESLNEKIANEVLLGTEYQIGHAYLMNLNYDESLSVMEVRKQLWKDFICPLLQEYLRGTGKEVELIASFEKSFGLNKDASNKQ